MAIAKGSPFVLAFLAAGCSPKTATDEQAFMRISSYDECLMAMKNPENLKFNGNDGINAIDICTKHWLLATHVWDTVISADQIQRYRMLNRR